MMPMTHSLSSARATTLRRSALLLGLALVACSKAAPDHGAGDVPAHDPAAGAMKDMFGMAKHGPAAESPIGDKAPGDATIPMTLSFTAGQIQHGKVQWAPVATSSTTSSAAVPGELTVNEDRTARLGAPGRGRVLAVRVQPGDPVSRGQVLVVLQSAEAGMAQSDVAKAGAEVTSRRAQAQYAASARARAERLLALKAIPRQDYERAVADDDQARAALAQATAEQTRARSTAEQLGAGGVGANGEIVLRAPLAGVVLERSAQPGAVVDAGAPLVVITDPTSLWLQIKAPEALMALFRRGGQLAFHVPAFAAEQFTARVEAVGAGLDPATRTLAVRALVANARARLKPAMLATVDVAGGPRLAAVLLPDDAVQSIDGKPTVFIVHPERLGGARFERRAVELGPRSGGQVAITRGLAAGDVVVTAGAFAVKSQFQKGSMPDMEM
jgi:cobalt-zinc-cadmium efflux system membrane fusion protein